ncbi:flagellar M-ring protein [bacterium BMS3Bbin06]|nr:flagellar M-ring protein [bacterium BMS3Bbin06]HDO36640.1 flagellar M-ring protein FliF [Nitrospirota bacterium]
MTGLKSGLERIQQWDMKRKTVSLALLVISLASIVLLISWANMPDYQVLFSNLQPDDSGLIIQKLKGMKVPFKVTASGILVPSEKVYELRLELAGMGLPQGGGVGYEVFDRTGLGTTEFVQKVNLRRALQGELVRTIKSLQEVSDCRVHLTIPDRSIFMESDNKPKASVLLKLRPGVSLSRMQVQGIVHLVSSSVDGLRAENITVIDQKGNILTTREDPLSALNNTQTEYRQGLEREIEKRVLNILEPVVGKNNVKARASVTVDFTRKEETLEQYDPDGQVVRSRRKLTEHKLTASQGGVPGVQSNLPGKKKRTRRKDRGSITKESETVNYEVSKVVSHIVRPTGSIKRMTVAVLVNGEYVKDKKDGTPKYVARTEEDLRKYGDIVRRAVGFSGERGDEIKVLNMPFKQEEAVTEEAAGIDFSRYILPAARYGTIVLLALLGIIFLVRPLMRYLREQPVLPRPAQSRSQSPASEIEGDIHRPALSKNDGVLEWAEKNPEQAASLIRKWVEEE